MVLKWITWQAVRANVRVTRPKHSSKVDKNFQATLKFKQERMEESFLMQNRGKQKNLLATLTPKLLLVRDAFSMLLSLARSQTQKLLTAISLTPLDVSGSLSGLMPLPNTKLAKA